MNLNQAYLFFIFFTTGILIGILFDLFRILRKSFKTSDFITTIQDIIFWIILSFLFFYVVFVFNNGEIRSYVFLGIASGLTTYILFFSKIFIDVNLKIILVAKKIIKVVFDTILYPIKIIFKLLIKIFLDPIAFIFINIRKNIKNCFNIMSKTMENKKKIHKNRKTSKRLEGNCKKV